MTHERMQQLLEAANLLINARRNHKPIADLPLELQPKSLEDAAVVHGIMATAFGPIGGWKIGAGSPDATPFFAPMPLAWMARSGTLLAGPRFRYRVLEAEIAFLLGHDLPPRAKSYSRDEVVAAMLADLQMHGGFIHGPACPNWKKIDFKTETVTLSIDGKLEVERTGSNTSGDLMRLLPYLANEGATRTGGLKAGQWITTGSWTGNTPARPGSLVEVAFAHAGSVSLRFA
jgi:2-keto-4-pentenoate hydratase